MPLTWLDGSGPVSSTVLDTPIGRLWLSANAQCLLSIGWEGAEQGAPATPLLAEAAAALSRYFQDATQPLNLPLGRAGTPYQRRVWERMAAIPAGEMLSYGHLARELGSGARAVAAACRANPYPLVIPCHRVVATHGLGGYCGASDGHWLDVKRWLLDHEARAARG